MTIEEKLISCCKYYKGEEENPFEFWKKGTFWGFERTTVNAFRDLEKFATTDDNEIIKKNIKKYVSALIGKWLPYNQDLILEY